MSIRVFWIMTLSGLVGGYQHFGGTPVTTYKTAWCFTQDTTVGYFTAVRTNLRNIIYVLSCVICNMISFAATDLYLQ
jgi:hypothetical protein